MIDPMPAMFPFASIPIFESGLATQKKQFRFPRSKKKRIIKKWAKQEKNFKHLPAAFMGKDEFGRQQFIIHPALKAQMVREDRRLREIHEQRWR